jgi:cell division protein FtsW (lipid II flippase)
MRRAAMLNRAIFWAVIGSIAVALLVLQAPFFAIQHQRWVATLFIISLVAFTISLAILPGRYKLH